MSVDEITEVEKKLEGLYWEFFRLSKIIQNALAQAARERRNKKTLDVCRKGRELFLTIDGKVTDIRVDSVLLLPLVNLKEYEKKIEVMEGDLAIAYVAEERFAARGVPL